MAVLQSKKIKQTLMDSDEKKEQKLARYLTMIRRVIKVNFQISCLRKVAKALVVNLLPTSGEI